MWWREDYAVLKNKQDPTQSACAGRKTSLNSYMSHIRPYTYLIEEAKARGAPICGARTINQDCECSCLPLEMFLSITGPQRFDRARPITAAFS